MTAIKIIIALAIIGGLIWHLNRQKNPPSGGAGGGDKGDDKPIAQN